MAIRHCAMPIAMFAVCAGSAYGATSSFTSDFVEGNSYSATLTANLLLRSGFDLVGLVIVSGDPLESPAMSNFSQAGWSETFSNDPFFPTVAAGSGPATSGTVSFDVLFSGDLATAVWTLDAVLFDTSSDTSFGTTRFVYDASQGGLISAGDISLTYDRSFFEAAVIPLPSGGALGVAGLAAVAIRRRRVA